MARISRSKKLDRFSIAQAKDKLPGLVHEVERGRAIEITRHGKAVAVIVSVDDYARMSVSRPSFGAALSSFLERWPAAGDGIDRTFLRGARPRGRGRKFSW